MELRMEPWHEMVIQSLEELSDLDFQEKVWVRGEGNMVSSFTEAVNSLYDDSGLNTLMKDGLVFSSKADQALNELHEYLKTFSPGQPAKSLIASDKWHKVIHLANRALLEVREVLT
jgi:hypothetical protein